MRNGYNKFGNGCRTVCYFGKTVDMSLFVKVLFLVAVSAKFSTIGGTEEPGNDLRVRRSDICPTIMGSSDICFLRYNQVTWPGTHNSGSGFSGNLRLINGFPAASCFYRNQDLNYTAQLEFGIRWFDIDLCWVTDDEATTTVPAGLWTCHSNGYAGMVEDIVQQVNEWLNQNRNEIVSIYFNDDYDQSRSGPISEALNELLERYWVVPGELAMNTAFNTTGQWPTLYSSSNANQRVFLFLHQTLQLGNQTWAHNPVPSTDPGIVVKDTCDELIDFARSVCNVCTDMWGLDAIGSRGNCIYRTAEICNEITYNVSRGCFDLRMEYGKTLNVIEVDYPNRSPEGRSVVDIAYKLNALNLAFFSPPPSPSDLPNVTSCTPAFTPTPSPSPLPRPATYCAALRRISQTPLYYFQCSPNTACDTLTCPVDLFADGNIFTFTLSVENECDEVGALVMEIFAPGTNVPTGRVSANQTGVYILLAFPLQIRIDQLDGALGAAVDILTGDGRPGTDNVILPYNIIPKPTKSPDCPEQPSSAPSSIVGSLVNIILVLQALALALLISA